MQRKCLEKPGIWVSSKLRVNASGLFSELVGMRCKDLFLSRFRYNVAVVSKITWSAAFVWKIGNTVGEYPAVVYQIVEYMH
jgi:hypothetical protein